MSLRAEGREIGTAYPITVRMLTPDRTRFVLLYNGSLQIREEVTLFLSERDTFFYSEGKQIISIVSNQTSPLLKVLYSILLRVIMLLSPLLVLLLATSAATCQR